MWLTCHSAVSVRVLKTEWEEFILVSSVIPAFHLFNDFTLYFEIFS